MALTAGTAAAGKISRHSIAVSCGAASGGVPPYTYQWLIRWPRGSSSFANASGSGVTALAATITGLGPAARYQIKLSVVDADLAIANSNILAVATLGNRWFAGLADKRRRQPAD